MADEPTNDDQNQEPDDFGALSGDSDSGGDENEAFSMGSLPPLSDFDSTADDSDSDLPPLDTPDSESGDDEPVSGLPPIVDIKVDTPAVRPSDLDTPEPSKKDLQQTPSPAGFDTPTSDLDSPSPSGLGFQDFAADSDFSPETPEIGPGPDSDIETPMFDSAFGGDSESFSTGTAPGEPAPTQAMETPLFGSQAESSGPSSGGGFEEGAFGVPTPDIGTDTGTPVPDFSPDTGAGVGPDALATPAPPTVTRRKRGGVVGILTNVALVLVGIVIGVVVSPMISGSIPFLPEPAAEELAAKDAEIADLERRLAREISAGEGTVSGVTPEERDRLLDEFEQTKADLNRAETQLANAEESLRQKNTAVTLVNADIEEANDRFVSAQDILEDLYNETRITQARHNGLLAENDRLSDMVGELEIANARRQSTKDTLLHNIDLLIVQVQGGSPLAPQRYDYADRVTRATSLREKVARAKWVDPQVMDEYTNLYLSELGIAASREYFFARIPVHDDLGSVEYQWAECLMNGNWSVYFRTLDGKNVGSYENISGSGPPQYEFREDLPGSIREDIIEDIKAARVEGYEDKIKVLQGKQKIYDTQTDLQRSFSSL